MDNPTNQLRLEIEKALKESGLEHGLVVHAPTKKYMPHAIAAIAERHATAQSDKAVREFAEKLVRKFQETAERSQPEKMILAELKKGRE